MSPPQLRASSYLAGCLTGGDDDFNDLLQPFLIARLLIFLSILGKDAISYNVHLIFRPPGSLALAQARQHIVSHLQSLGWQVFTLDMAAINTLGDSAVGIHADWSQKCRKKIVLALYFFEIEFSRFPWTLLRHQPRLVQRRSQTSWQLFTRIVLGVLFLLHIMIARSYLMLVAKIIRTKNNIRCI